MLFRTNLSEANLSNANLSNANLSKALKGVPKTEQHKRNMSLGKLAYWKNKHLLMITQLKK
jgi:uncharacterized protein YjbI with pentapeptide repeats